MGFSSACFTHALFSAYMVYKFSSKVSMHHAPHRIKALSAISLAFDTKVIELKSQIGLQPQENIFGLLESILMKRSFHPPSSSLHEKKLGVICSVLLDAPHSLHNHLFIKALYLILSLIYYNLFT